MTKFLIVGDLHGNKPNIYYKDFDAIIAPGDFCSDAPKTYMFQALKEHLQNPKSKTRWYDLTGKTKAEEMIEKSLKDGRVILEFLNSFNIPVYLVPGNWDWTGKTDYGPWSFLKKDRFKDLISGLENVIDVHHKLINAGNYQIIGHGITSGPEWPQDAKDLDRLKTDPKKYEKRRKEYEKENGKVERLFKKARKPVIFMPHNVPYNTPIDLITNRESPRYGMHFGSLIAREMIDRYQPLVCISGHMHEHFTSCEIGKTTAINAGFGSFVNVFLELLNGKVSKLEFHNGEQK